MPSDQSTVDYLTEQMSRGNDVRARRMFGEYGVYCGEKFVGIVSDDQLYLKNTEAGRALVPDADEGPPYPNASPHLVVPEDVIEDADRLSELVCATAEALPPPKPKKPRRSGSG